MHHLNHKAIILNSYKDSLALHKALFPIMGHATHITVFNETWFKSHDFSPVVCLDYFMDSLYWSWGRSLQQDYDYTYLPIKVILNPSGYPEYFI